MILYEDIGCVFGFFLIDILFLILVELKNILNKKKVFKILIEMV